VILVGNYVVLGVLVAPRWHEMERLVWSTEVSSWNEMECIVMKEVGETSRHVFGASRRRRKEKKAAHVPGGRTRLLE
jgi:hypothetical protein